MSSAPSHRASKPPPQTGFETIAAPPMVVGMDGSDPELDAFEKRLGYRFRDRTLLDLSLTHPSVLQERPGSENNQRLEFLGDAVLQLIISERLHALFPDEREGSLTRKRATLTRGSFLATLARELGVHDVLRMSASERSAGGANRQAALEDATEALVAAVYLDSDYAATRTVVLAWLGDMLQRIESIEQEMNPKGTLQELVQPRFGNSALAYHLIGTEGPPHDRRFEVEVRLHDRPIGRGTGSSKKEAEESAANAALANRSPEGF